MPIRSRVASIWFTVAVVVLTLGFLYLVRAILPPFLLGLVIVYLLEPPVGFLIRHGFTRPRAVAFIFLLAFLALAVGVTSILPGLAQEFNRFLEAFPEIVESYTLFLENIANRYDAAGLPASVRAIIDEAIQNVQASLLRFLRLVVESAVSVAQSTVEFLVSPVLAYYVLKDFDRIKPRSLALLPGGAAGKWAEVIRRIDRTLNAFIRGQAVLGVVVATAVTSLAIVLRLRFALLIGFVSFVGEFVPYFGPVLAAIPAVLSGLSRAPVVGLETLVGFTVIQQLEANLLAPRVLGESLGIHPVAIVFVLLTGGHLGGFWGLLLSVPIFVVLRTFAEFAYLEYVGVE